MTAVYKGTKKAGTGQIWLRSYDSRKEPAVAPNATIWQAGRATAATALAFKPIQIGQSVFLDEGTGKYNPAPMVLDEAVCNEWPGREIGVFLSIGTGKRPDGTNNQEHLWWEGFVSGGIGDFAEARRRLISKIEGCEKTHKEMKDHLAKRQVNPENYYRLNVNVGVGEFGMNEWNALSEISTNTRMYLAEKDVQSMTLDASAKIARIHRAKLRWERAEKGQNSFPQQPPHHPTSLCPPSPIPLVSPSSCPPRKSLPSTSPRCSNPTFAPRPYSLTDRNTPTTTSTSSFRLTSSHSPWEPRPTCRHGTLASSSRPAAAQASSSRPSAPSRHTQGLHA